MNRTDELNLLAEKLTAADTDEERRNLALQAPAIVDHYLDTAQNTSEAPEWPRSLPSPERQELVQAVIYSHYASVVDYAIDQSNFSCVLMQCGPGDQYTILTDSGEGYWIRGKTLARDWANCVYIFERALRATAILVGTLGGDKAVSEFDVSKAYDGVSDHFEAMKPGDKMHLGELVYAALAASDSIKYYR